MHYRVSKEEETRRSAYAASIFFAKRNNGPYRVFLGEHPLRRKSFRYDTNLGGYVANVTEERLQNAPEYAGEESWSDRDWEIRLNKNYGAAPYGEDTTISTSKGDESPRGGW